MNNHTLIIEQRKRIQVTAVINTERFSEKEVLVYTECGDLLIKGSALEVNSCTSPGEIEISGHIDSVAYVSENYHIPDNFLARLFK